jgi:cysteine desulfuration protein SufE
MSALDDKLLRFRTLSREMRLQLLLKYSKSFPELPGWLSEVRDEGLGRVEECHTPLFLWVSVNDAGTVQIHADAPREAPTVRGFVGFLMDVLNGQPAEAVAELPDDLMERMGLDEVLGVMRTRGLGAVLYKIKQDTERAAA